MTPPELDLQRRRHRRALDADLREIQQAAATISDLVRLIPRAHVALVAIQADGLPAGTRGEPTSGGETGRPTESAALARQELAAAHTALHADLEACRKFAMAAFYKANVIAGRIEPGDIPALAPGSGNCLACDRWVAGTSTDRIRSGYCPACATAWTRARQNDPNIDRFRFENTRRTQPEDETA